MLPPEPKKSTRESGLLLYGGKFLKSYFVFVFFAQRDVPEHPDNWISKKFIYVSHLWNIRVSVSHCGSYKSHKRLPYFNYALFTISLMNIML